MNKKESEAELGSKNLHLKHILNYYSCCSILVEI